MKRKCIKLFIPAVICIALLSGCTYPAEYVENNNEISDYGETTLSAHPEQDPSEEDDVPKAPAAPNPNKPGGFILNEDNLNIKPPQDTNLPKDDDESKDDSNPNNQPENPIEDDISAPSSEPIKMSQGLRAALLSLGKTNRNGTNVVAYHLTPGLDGGIPIIHIKGSNSATQYNYIYYDTEAQYRQATGNMSSNACNDELRLVLTGSVQTSPVSNPESLDCVLFDGYKLYK